MGGGIQPTHPQPPRKKILEFNDRVKRVENISHK
jgi:hypothetical protein